MEDRESDLGSMFGYGSLLLFDEPTSALDPELTGEVVKVMQQMAAEGMTMVVVTHEMSFARQAADEIIFMENGHIVEQGSPEAMFTDSVHARTRAFLNVIAEHGRAMRDFIEFGIEWLPELLKGVPITLALR